MAERVCPKCNTAIKEEDKFCPICGTESEPIQSEPIQLKTENENAPKATANTFWSGWSITAVISFLCACFTFYKGYDKMAHYYSSEIASLTKNAYVGGDAYNYIINGTYATSYFVLTAMFVLAAVGLIIIHYVSKMAKTSTVAK